MARRGLGGPKTGEYIGGAGMDTAKHAINDLMLRTCAEMTEFTPSFEQTVEMLFPPDDVAKARAARGIVVHPANLVSYTVGRDAKLSLNFHQSLTMPIREDRLLLQPHKVAPLMKFLGDTEAIYLRFEQVKGVLRWMNQHATKAAIRYYWPTVLQLAPGSFQEYAECPTRFAIPEGIDQIAQSLRDTATTMASARMLSGTVEGRTRDAMWLTFAGRTVTEGELCYRTDDMTVNL